METIEEVKARCINNLEKYYPKYVELRKKSLSDNFIEDIISFPDNKEKILYPHHVLWTTWHMINEWPYHIEQIIDVCIKSDKINWVEGFYKCDFWTALCTKCPS